MAKEELKVVRMEVVRSDTGEVVRVIDTSGQAGSGVEKVLMGLLRQMDTDQFFVREVLG